MDLFGIGRKLAWVRSLVDPFAPYNDIPDDGWWDRTPLPPPPPPNKVMVIQGGSRARNRVVKKPKVKSVA